MIEKNSSRRLLLQKQPCPSRFALHCHAVARTLMEHPVAINTVGIRGQMLSRALNVSAKTDPITMQHSPNEVNAIRGVLRCWLLQQLIEVCL